MAQSLTDGDPHHLGAYELLGRLGEGGQGVVYLGRSPEGTLVAVKLLHAWLTGDAEARARFLGEVSVAQRVARFCTAPVLHADLAGNQPYIVSEYVPGPSLRELVAAEGPRRGASLDRLAISTVTALAAIHQAGIMHRDFKPANVLMGPEGPVVIDFGVARALDRPGSTATGETLGTPSYLAPEQLSGGTATPAADVFAWGVTMVFAASGTPAFGADTIPAVITRILNEQPDLTALDGHLRDLVAACLSKDPARRPTAEDLLAHLLGRPVAAVQPDYADQPDQPDHADHGNAVVPARTPSDAGAASGQSQPGSFADGRAGPDSTHGSREGKKTASVGPRRSLSRRTIALSVAALVVAGILASSAVALTQAVTLLSAKTTSAAETEPFRDGTPPVPEASHRAAVPTTPSPSGEPARPRHPDRPPTGEGAPAATPQRPAVRRTTPVPPHTSPAPATPRPITSPGGTQARSPTSSPNPSGTPSNSPMPSKSSSPPRQPTPGHEVIGAGSHRCIDVKDRAQVDGTPLQLWDCTGAEWQKWDFRSDGTARSMELCMQVAGGSTANGAPIEVAHCNGSPAQQFALNAAHDLVNLKADKCVDAKDVSTSNGVRLQLWSCVGTSNQKWSLG